MKMKSQLVILSFVIIMLCNKCELPNYYDINYVNNADYDINCQVLDGRGEYKIYYPDTTISFKKNMGLIKARSHTITIIGTLPIENYFDKLPNDTLSVFYFHPDTVAKYSWTEIQQGYKILQRYDLSIEDLHKLYNNYGVPEITYPPTEAMKDMKMYPPYGQ